LFLIIRRFLATNGVTIVGECGAIGGATNLTTCLISSYAGLLIWWQLKIHKLYKLQARKSP